MMFRQVAILSLVLLFFGLSAQAAPLDPQLRSEWQSFQANLKRKDLTAANQDINDLLSLRQKAGYSELYDYSEKLIEMSYNSSASGEKELAKYLARKALELSPYSPGLILHCGSHLVDLGLFNHKEVFFRVLEAGAKRYDFIISGVIKFIYPALWAGALASIATFFLVFLANCHHMLQRLCRVLPKKGAKPVSAAILSTALAFPLLAGPLWTLVLYTLFLYLLLPRYKRFGALTAVLLLLWAFLVPIRENSTAWISSSENQELLRIYSGVYSENDLTRLNNLKSKSGLTELLTARVLRRSRQLEKAKLKLDEAAKAGFDPILIEIEKAGILFLQGNSEEADKIYAKYHEEYSGNAAFLYNYSKIKFDLTDTEASRELFDQASSANRTLAEEWRLKEAEVGFDSAVSLADINPGVSELASLILRPQEGTKQSSDLALSKAAPGMSFSMLTYFGIGLFIAVFLIRASDAPTKQAARKKPYFKPLHSLERAVSLIPAGNSILSGAPLRAFFTLLVIAILSFPFFKWPADMSEALRRLYGLELYYVYGYCFLIAALSYIGFSSYERSAD